MKIDRKNTISLMVLVIAGIITLSFYSKSNINEVNNSAEQNRTSQTTNSEASGVSFKDEKGETISLNSLKGKVVFINFWATWCGPCIREMPSINTLKKSFKEKDDIVFLMVDVDGNLKKSSAFMTRYNFDLPVVIPNGNIPSTFLGGAIPTTVVLSKEGEMVARAEGGRDYSSPEIKQFLDKLIANN